MNLGGFGAGMALGLDDAEQRRLVRTREQLEIGQAQRTLDARRAYADWALSDETAPATVPYATPMPPALTPQAAPQSPMPGQPSVRMVRPPLQQRPAAFGAPPMGATAGAAAPSPAAPPVMPPMAGGYDLRTMMRQIAAKNPGLDKATLFEAAMQGQALMSPQGKMELQYLQALMRMDGQLQALDTRLSIAGMQDSTRRELAGIAADIKRDIASQRDTTARRGQDIRAGTAERGQDLAHEDRQGAEAGRNQRAADRVAAAEPGKEYNTLATQLRSVKDKITDLIRENGGTLPGPGSKGWTEYQTLKGRRDAPFDRMMAARQKAQRAGQRLPSPAEAVTSGGEGARDVSPGTKDNPAKPTTQADFDALPKGAFYLDPDDPGQLYQK